MRVVRQHESKEAADRLRQHGIRPLQMRVAIYDYLLKHNIHPTVETIYQELIVTHPGMSKTTIYNVLDLLYEHKVINKVSIEEREMRYDADVSEHAHFRCTTCNKIFDIRQMSLPQPQVPVGFTVNDIQINIDGTCPDCGKAS
jgi:Fe2+ or Zn2+ uptake regulation protein